ALVMTLAVGLVPFLPDGGPRELYDRTLGYQAGRGSPFSVWGQEPGLGWLHTVAKAGVLLGAVAVAAVPRTGGPRQVAALGAVVVIGLQLVATHWFYLYVVWFTPLVLVVVMGVYRRPPSEPEQAPAPPAREAVPA
ncbi:MAG: hypothetical protein H0U84_04620, partial [Thermoleophilaceae bacterium]|nr:hypothetical protein [Thermoleophilaceae bacterium]